MRCIRLSFSTLSQDVYLSAHERIDIDTLAREQDAMSVRVWHKTGLAYNWDAGNEVHIVPLDRQTAGTSPYLNRGMFLCVCAFCLVPLPSRAG